MTTHCHFLFFTLKVNIYKLIENNIIDILFKHNKVTYFNCLMFNLNQIYKERNTPLYKESEIDDCVMM